MYVLTDEQRIKLLADILESYAPDTDSAKLVANFTSKHQTNDSERLLSLVGAIYDGLAYGNWPWVVAKMKRTQEYPRRKA